MIPESNHSAPSIHRLPLKREPQWMLDFRLKALDIFLKKPMPTWGADLSGIVLLETAKDKPQKSSGLSTSPGAPCHRSRTP